MSKPIYVSENPAIEALWQRHDEWTERLQQRHDEWAKQPPESRDDWVDGGPVISPEEWRLAFEALKAFHYHSPNSRLMDCDFAVFLGAGELQRAGLWDESIQVIAWALSDRQFLKESRMISTAHYYMAVSLFGKGEVDEALSYYLRQTQRLPKGAERSMTYSLGIHVFLHFKPGWNRDVEGDGSENVPPNILQFGRQLAKANYPNRKLPVALREASPPTYSWDVIHDALDKLRR